jgi:hypothetical protein
VSQSRPVATPSNVDLRNRYLAGFLAWLVPGLGHWYQGRKSKAILYASCILGLFFVGLLMGEGRNVFFRWTSPTQDSENFRFSYFCQFFAGLPTLPGLIQATLKHYGWPPIFWGYLAEPSLNQLNAVHPRLGPLVEVGWVYTVIAGLLNVLAILDAFDGPAHGDEPEETSKSSRASSATLSPQASA